MEGATLLISHAVIVKVHVTKLGMIQVAVEFDGALMPEGGGEFLGGLYAGAEKKSIKFMIQKNTIEKTKKKKEESNPLAQKFFKNMLIDNPKFYEFLSGVAQCQITTVEEAHQYVRIMMGVESLADITEGHTKKVISEYKKWREENGKR